MCSSLRLRRALGATGGIAADRRVRAGG
jgi:hypothetical protein